ncbi:MAG: cyclase family protein [Anaerolineaceae bacterium]
MKWFDISVEISATLPVWPGDPSVSIERIQKLEDGANANVSRMDMGLHTGTHVDAPYHFLTDGAKISEVPLQHFFGPVTVIEIPGKVDVINADVLGRIDRSLFTERILFKTRNSGFWSETEEHFHNDFVGIDLTGAQFLVDRGVHLVGIDYLSIAPFHKSKPTHETLLGAGVVIVEGLNLSAVPPGTYALYCLPLKLGNAEAAPARAILIKD